MTRKRQIPRVRLALFGILLIMIGCYFVFTKRIPFVHGYLLKADFQSSNQLVPGFSPVRVAGVTIGKVTKVERGEGNTSRVTMELKDTALPIHADARVKIRPRLFLEGGFYVELDPGSPSGENIDSGTVLPTDQTAVPVQLHQILATFDITTRDSFASLVDEFNQAFGNGGAKALGQTFEPLNPVLREGAQIARASQGVTAHDPSNGIRATAKITQVLADHRENLQGLVTSLNRTSSALAARDTQLAQTISGIDTLVRTAPTQLDRIDATLPPINRFTAAIRPTLRALPPVLDHTVPVLDQLNKLVSPNELPRLITELTPAAQQLGPLTDRLNVLFPLVTPVNECVTNKVVPIVNAEVPDGNLSSGRPAWQDLAHSVVSLSSAASNFDANGFAVRFQAGVGETAVGTGAAPGVGQLSGLTTEGISGSNPLWYGPNADPPPLVASEECRDQPLADLTQRTGTASTESARKVNTTARSASLVAGRTMRELVQQWDRGVKAMGASR